MEGANFTGYENSFGFSGGHGSPSKNMIDQGDNDAFSQQEHTSNNTCAQAMHHHLELLTSLSPTCQPQSTVERWQAELQPRAAAAPETPHTTYISSQGSQAMSRGPSRLSNQSSASLHQHYGRIPSFSPLDPFQHNYPPDSTQMFRSSSDLPITQDYSFNSLSPIVQPYPFPFGSFPYNFSPPPLPTGLPITPQCSPLTSYLDESKANLSTVQPPTLGDGEATDQHFGQNILRHSNRLIAPVAQFRRRTKPNTHVLHRPPPVKVLSNPQISLNPSLSSNSTTSSETPPPEPQTKRRRGRPASLSDKESDPVTGHILVSGQFQCAKPECAVLRFGRQADFRRHWTNVHAKSKIEWFCTEEGCIRSKRPRTKLKGRSFGARKDKMEEHMSAVHSKNSKEKKKPFEPEIYEEEEYCEDDDDEMPPAKALKCS